MTKFTRYRIVELDTQLFIIEQGILWGFYWYSIGLKESLDDALNFIKNLVNKGDENNYKTKIYPVNIQTHSYQSPEKCGTFKTVSIQKSHD